MTESTKTKSEGSVTDRVRNALAGVALRNACGSSVYEDASPDNPAFSIGMPETKRKGMERGWGDLTKQEA
jgi:hypothetical protein